MSEETLITIKVNYKQNVIIVRKLTLENGKIVAPIKGLSKNGEWVDKMEDRRYPDECIFSAEESWSFGLSLTDKAKKEFEEFGVKAHPDIKANNG
jgi:hypothetical protein